jgi:hypothetical protein
LVLKAGRNVGGDLSRLEREFNCVIPKTYSVELGSLARTKGYVKNGCAALQALSAYVLRAYLPKPDDVRISKWDQVTLSPEQIRYSALDALASEMVAVKLHQSDEVGKPVTNFTDGKPVHLRIGSNNHRFAAFGSIHIPARSVTHHHGIKLTSKNALLEVKQVLLGAYYLRYYDEREDQTGKRLRYVFKIMFICQAENN